MSQQVLDPRQVYENSWCEPSEKFPFSKVKTETDRILAAKFKTAVFESKASGLLLREATDEISKALGRVVLKQFKWAIQLTLSEKVGQAFFSGSMCLWDPEHDNYVSTSFENSNVMVIAIIFGSLLE
jgi:hypothetical protein